MEQLELSLRIIAGLEDAFNHWNVFFSKSMPDRDRVKVDANEYKEKVRREVKGAACSYVTSQITYALNMTDDGAPT